MRLLDEVAEHLLGRLEIGDHPITHGPDRGDAARRAPEHLLRLAANRFDLVADVVDGHDGGFIQDDAGTARKDAGIGRTEIDRQVIGEEREGA
jgi:hypothetical protein